MIEQKLFSLVAKVEYTKLSTTQEKAQRVSWFVETQTDIQAQRNSRQKYGREPFTRTTIQSLHKKFMETGSVYQKNGSGRSQTLEEEIESVPAACTRSRRKYSQSFYAVTDTTLHYSSSFA